MGKGKGNIGFSKPPEPSFIKKLKLQVGYKEGPTINTKSINDHDDDDYEETREDEQPVVVVLNKGDITAEEADKIREKNEKEKDEQFPEDGKVQFKKPNKRKKEEEDSNIKEKKSKGKNLTNKKLLSFEDDEEDG